jgi:hypothetical protein
MVLALSLQSRQEHPARIGFGLGKSPLLGLHPRLAKDHVVSPLQELGLVWRMLLLSGSVDGSTPTLLTKAVGRFGFTVLASGLEHDGLVEFDRSLPRLAAGSVACAPARHSAGSGLLDERKAAAQLSLGLGDVAHGQVVRAKLLVGAE